MKMEKGHERTVLIGTSPSCSLSCWPVLMTPPLRCPVQQLLPSVSPAPAETAGETPLHGAAPAQQPGLLRGAPGALLRGLSPLWECRVDSPIQRVRKSFSSEEEIKGLKRAVSGAFHAPPPRCPNPLDPGPQQSVLLEPPSPSRGHVRRFTVNTFQFLQDAEVGNQEEEVRTSCCGSFLHARQEKLTDSFPQRGNVHLWVAVVLHLFILSKRLHRCFGSF